MPLVPGVPYPPQIEQKTKAFVVALVASPLLFFSATVSAHALARGAYIFGVGLDRRSVKDDYKDHVEKESGKNEN